jgi:hypothetical protein
MAINPARLGYRLVKNAGRQGEVKSAKALGRSYVNGLRRTYVNKCSCNNDSRTEMFDGEEYP